MDSTPFISDHPDIARDLIGLLIVIISGYTSMTLKTINANQKELFHRLTMVEKQVAHLKGSHDAIHGIMDRTADGDDQ